MKRSCLVLKTVVSGDGGVGRAAAGTRERDARSERNDGSDDGDEEGHWSCACRKP